jgi:hypothetical protein
MSQYPFNSIGFEFENPLSSITDKSNRNYWSVNIDSTDLLSVDFDILYWAPTSPITQLQAQKVIELSRRKTSVFIDASFLSENSSSSGLSNFGILFNAKSATSGFINLRTEYINGKDSFSGWNLPDFNESSAVLTYGITGRRKNILGSATLPVRVFDTTSSYSSIEQNVVAKISSDTLIYRATYNSNVNVEPEKPSVYFCSYNISSYLNDIYGTSGLNGLVNDQQNNRINFSTNQFNPIIEGPCKVFYNIVSESIKNKIVSSRVVSQDSSR